MQKRRADDWAPHAREPSPPPSPASPARGCAPWPATAMGGTAAAAHLPAGEVRTAAQQGGPRPRRPDGSGARAGWGGGTRKAAAACKGLGGATLSGIRRVRGARQRCGSPLDLGETPPARTSPSGQRWYGREACSTSSSRQPCSRGRARKSAGPFPRGE